MVNAQLNLKLYARSSFDIFRGTEDPQTVGSLGQIVPVGKKPVGKFSLLISFKW